jgi:CxxC-x17-CxxC domain-containing protein
MAGFESFRKGKKSSSRGGHSKDSRRNFNRKSRSRKPVERTTVICSACGKKCEVPFKPTSSKPVYCDDCFIKLGRDNNPRGSVTKGISEEDLDIINKKLNKIMEHLKIK